MKKILLLGLVFILLTTCVNAALIDGQISYWKFDVNNVTQIDSHGSNNANVNSGTYTASGKINGAYDYDGTSNYMSVPDSASLDVTTQFTWNGWIKRDGSGKFSYIVNRFGGVTGVDRIFMLVPYRDAGATDFSGFSVTVGNNLVLDTLFGSSGSLTSNKWTMVTVTFNSGDLRLYVNGSLDTNKSTVVTSLLTGTQPLRFGSSATGGANFDGVIDELSFWNVEKTPAEIEQLFADYAGNQYPYELTSLTLLSPANDTYHNTDLNFTFEYTNYNANNCSLYDNRTGSWQISKTITNVQENISIGFENTSINSTDGSYLWNVYCYSNSSNLTATTNRTFVIDTINPILTINNPNPNNSTEISEPLRLNITVDDLNNYVTIVNITNPNGTILFNKEYNTTGFKVYNITNLINMTATGYYEMYVLAADGHTKQKIKKIDHKIKDKKINFKEGEVLIYPDNINKYESVSTKYNTDRYNFNFKKAKTKTKTSYDEFYVEAQEIEIIKDSKYAGHMIVRNGHINNWYWLDFETDKKFKVETFQESKSKIRVRVYGDGSDYEFNSLGRLNIVNKTVTYYYDGSNITTAETFENPTVDGFETDYYLNVTYNRLKYNSSITTPVGILNLDGTNYSTTLLGYNSTVARFKTTIPLYLNLTSLTTIQHHWYFKISNLNGALITHKTANQSQEIYAVYMGVCNATLTNKVLDIYYYDELNASSALTVDNGYNLQITDGVYSYDQIGSFSGNTNDEFCTNLPTNITYNWNVWGTFALSKDDYTTRIITIPEANPILASNNPTTVQNFYLIPLNESTTVQYTWIGTDYSLLNGIMEIYRCNINGSEELIESTTITTGTAIANIELLTGVYKYKAIIDGIIYEDPSFSTCHTEASNEITYYVDISENEISPVIGLYLIDCVLTENNRTVNMQWSINLDDDSQIEACIVGYRQTFSNFTEVYRNCSNSTDYNYSVYIPESNNVYLVRGEITQDSTTGYCNDEFSFNANREKSEVFGINGIFATVILILGLSLLYAGDDIVKIVGAIVAIIISWIIGIVSFDWLLVSTMISFLIIIIWIAKYARSPQ